MENTGAENIYKLNLLEAMLISEESSRKRSFPTAGSTKIQQFSPPALICTPEANEQVPASNDLKAWWEIVKSPHVSDMTLPEVEKQFKDVPGSQYEAKYWMKHLGL